MSKKYKNNKSNKTILAFIIASVSVLVIGVITVIALIVININEANAKLARDEHVNVTEENYAINDVSNNIVTTVSKENASVKGKDSEDNKELTEKEKKLALYNAYATALSTICEGAVWIDDRTHARCPYLLSYNYYNAEAKDTNNFSISDIDNDGIEELVVEINNASIDNKITVIYQYDFENDTFYREASFYPGAVFYNNDVVFDEWSYNTGFGNFIWPYSVYKYDKEQDTYIFICQVNSWNKKLKSEGFPEEIDADKDGNIVIISEANENQYLDNADYYKWISGITEGSKEKTLKMEPMYNANYINFATDYIDYMVNKVSNDLSEDAIDLGVIFAGSKSPYDEISENLMEKYGLEFSSDATDDKLKNASSDLMSCELDGQPVIGYDMTDGGSVIYYNYISGVSVFGIYPGMSEKPARVTLREYGFKEGTYGNYRLGSAGWHIDLTFDAKDGEIGNIKITIGSDFAG